MSNKDYTKFSKREHEENKEVEPANNVHIEPEPVAEPAKPEPV